MYAKKKHVVAVLLVAGFVFVCWTMLNGCKKEEPKPTATGTGQTAAHSEMAMATNTAKEIAGTEQTICPVMGQPIDKQYFTEYQGKKVYFCCPACDAKFKADPEKYLAKLPQFSQAAEK